MWNSGSLLQSAGILIFLAYRMPLQTGVGIEATVHQEQLWEEVCVTHWPRVGAENNLTNEISDHIVQIKFICTSGWIAPWWMPQSTFDDKSTLVGVSAVRQQAITWVSVIAVILAMDSVEMLRAMDWRLREALSTSVRQDSFFPDRAIYILTALGNSIYLEDVCW